MWDEALKLAGLDPDFHRRDLFEAIEAGQFPEWELGFQYVSACAAHRTLTSTCIHARTC